MRKITFIFLLLLTTEVFSQSSFRKRIEIPYLGGGYGDFNNSPKMKRCFDGGYVLSGLMESWTGGNDAGFIIKMDSSGTIEWQKKFEAAGVFGYGVNILSTPDSGFYFGMRTSGQTWGQFGSYDLFRLDKFGNILEQKISPDPFGGLAGDDMKFIEIEKDTDNLIVVGEYYYDDGNQDPCCDSLYFRKFDASLNVLFSKKIDVGFGYNYYNRVTAGCKIYNSGIASGYLVGGFGCNIWMDTCYTTLLKFNNNTQLLWRMNYKTSYNGNNIMDILQVDSTFYILETKAIRKIDYYGNTLFYKILDSTLNFQYYSDIAIGDSNNLLIAGASVNPIMIEIDFNGNITHAKIGTELGSSFWGIDTSTKGFLFVRITGWQTANSAIEFARQFIDSASCNFIPITLTPYNGLIQDSPVVQTTHTYNPPLFPWSHPTDTMSYVPTLLCTSVGISNVTEESNELNLFPNPAAFSFYISTNIKTAHSIEIYLYNPLGSQIYFSKEEISAGKFSREINVQHLADGIYFLHLKTEEGVLSRKVAVQH